MASAEMITFSQFCSRFHLSKDEICELFDHWLMVRARSMRKELRKACSESKRKPVEVERKLAIRTKGGVKFYD